MHSIFYLLLFFSIYTFFSFKVRFYYQTHFVGRVQPHTLNTDDRYPNWFVLPNEGPPEFRVAVNPVAITQEDKDCEGYEEEEMTLVATRKRVRRPGIGFTEPIAIIRKATKSKMLFEFIVKLWKISEHSPFRTSEKPLHVFEIVEMSEYKP